MQGVLNWLQNAGLHPVVDHFTVALVIVAVLADLVASLIPTRWWIRSMATTLMVVGALAAMASKVTGGWAADIVWDHLSDPAKQLLRRHAFVGHWLAYALVVLALWRLALHFFDFAARSRPLYLLFAVIAAAFMLYQGDLGGDLVYDYGVGTAPMLNAAPTIRPTPQPSTSAPPPAEIPTVVAPTSSAQPTPTATAMPATPTATASASSQSSPGTPINPPPGPGAASASPSGARTL
ncbi:MAG TPA: DUF2231 domain-containing protein [Candidatus Binataceae bacterium]|jgi:uncharacterized membrane protein|nr:DUF2231 domain-containing protein [Candidatus Binataceae bacterium]